MGQIGSRMPRKLKTYVTNLGFFELALAAPSMKAALEAWGMGHNAFHQGFAKETDDPKIVAATMAQPGVVLKRPVGTKGPFTENAALPKEPWALTAPKVPKAAPTPPRQKVKARAKPPTEADSKRDKAAILSFQKAKEQRDRARAEKEAAEAARQEKEQDGIARAVAKAEEALRAAQTRHDDAMKAIEAERDKLDRRAAAENQRWAAERKKLQAAALQAAKR